MTETKKMQKTYLQTTKYLQKEQNGKWGYVDKNGNTVVDFKYDMAIDLMNMALELLSKMEDGA